MSTIRPTLLALYRHALTVSAGEERTARYDRALTWAVLLDGDILTDDTEWPSDNPTIDLTVRVREDGRAEVIDD